MEKSKPISGEKPALLETLSGKRQDIPPVWLMRQAGRYLPEYRALRAQKGGFLELVYDSQAAATVTLQPIERFAMDGAILFSDILIVPYAMGQDLSFGPGEGPKLRPAIDVERDVVSLKARPERLDAIYKTIGKIIPHLPRQTAMIGFAGSPWTVATYMTAGDHTGKDHKTARQLAYGHEKAFSGLIQAISEMTLTYLVGQVQAGVQVVQLFDSWSGSLSSAQFRKWVIEPTRDLVRDFKLQCPQIPVIGFPRGGGAKIVDYAHETHIDALGLDETTDPHWAHAVLPKNLPVQGNLDPCLLWAGGERLDTAVAEIKAAFSDRPHIFNLGHGIFPETPIAHVERLLKQVRRG